MSTRKRQRWTPELRAEALRIARQEGVSVAAERLGINAGTIRSWRSRDTSTPPTDDESIDPEREANQIEATPVEALSVGEWVELQRQAEQRLRRSLAHGTPSATRWLSVSLAVISDKLRIAQQAEAENAREHRSFATATGAERDEIAALVWAAIEQRDQLRRAALSAPVLAPGVIEFEVRERYAVMRRLQFEITCLFEERRRRDAGEPSLFAEPEPASAPPLAQTPRPLVKGTNAWELFRDPTAPDAAVEIERAEAEVARIESRMARRHLRVQRGKVIRHAHLGLRPHDLRPPDDAA